MATIGLGANASTAAAGFTTTPDTYTTIDQLLEHNKDDNRELLIKTYGDQGITGFLKLTGAIKNGGTADFLQYWEEQRRHRLVDIGTQTFTQNSSAAGVVEIDTDLSGADAIEVQTVVMNASSGEVYICTVANNTFSLLGTAATGTDWASNDELIILGNLYDQGTDQPTQFMKTDPTKRTNQ